MTNQLEPYNGVCPMRKRQQLYGKVILTIIATLTVMIFTLVVEGTSIYSDCGLFLGEEVFGVSSLPFVRSQAKIVVAGRVQKIYIS